MTIDELVERARREGWKLRAPSHGLDSAQDNVHVVDRDDEGWFLGFLERGETSVIARFATEAELADAAYARLVAHYRPQTSAPTAASQVDASGRTSSWTVPRHETD
jgi:hypothetical protein